MKTNRPGIHFRVNKVFFGRRYTQIKQINADESYNNLKRSDNRLDCPADNTAESSFQNSPQRSQRENS